MKDNVLKAIGWIAIFCILIFGITYVDIIINKNVLERNGYEVIRYVNGSYKVFDKNTRVVYFYSTETHIFTPVYNQDGTLLLY